MTINLDVRPFHILCRGSVGGGCFGGRVSGGQGVEGVWGWRHNEGGFFGTFLLVESSSILMLSSISLLELRRTYLRNLRSQTPSVAYQKWIYPLTEFTWWGSQSWNPKFLITSSCHFDKNQNHFGLGCSQGSRELVFVLNNSSSTIC